MPDPQQYRKKPVVIQALHYPAMPIDAPGMVEQQAEIIQWCGGRRAGGAYELIAIDTLEGTMYAKPGDWVIRGVAGEFYPCRDDIFRQTYEPAATMPRETPRADSQWCPKNLRERLCVQQHYAPDDHTRNEIGRLIGLLDVHRPLGSNGKHGERRHTPTCGCEDK